MKILIGADTVPSAQTEKYFVDGDARALFGDLCDIAAEADRILVNLECALTEADTAIAKFGPNLKCDPRCTNGLKAFGVTDVLLSNNHTFDFGCQGLRDTMAALDAAGIPYTGIGENDTDSRKPHFFTEGGKTIGIVNICEHEYTYALPNRMGANPFDPFLTMQDIREAKKQCDYLIAIYHGGKEHCKYPSPRLYNLAHEMVYCGADVVIAQHSHCIGCYEKFEGAHIVYGQGNFNFTWPDFPEEGWHYALLIELTVEDGITPRFIPIVETETGCDLAKGEKAEKIMSAFEARNASLKDGTWKDGWKAFCASPDRKIYHVPILEACDEERKIQRFAHYLDCEAHTDVWRELYPTWNMTNEM